MTRGASIGVIIEKSWTIARRSIMRCKNHLQLDVRQHKNGGGLNVVKSRTSILNFENSYIYFKYNNRWSTAERLRRESILIQLVRLRQSIKEGFLPAIKRTRKLKKCTVKYLKLKPEYTSFECILFLMRSRGGKLSYWEKVCDLYRILVRTLSKPIYTSLVGR